MPNDAVGLESLQVNGEAYEVTGTCTYQTGGQGSPAGQISTPRTLPGGKVVHVITWREPYIEVELNDSGQLDVDALDKLRDATVVVRLVNGKTVQCSSCRVTGENPTNAQEGTLTRRFTGQRCEEVLTS